MRAARYDLPLMLAIIGGDPKRFLPYVDLYRRAYAQVGKPMKEIGVHSHGYVAATDELAREELWPDYKRMRDRIGSERGWPPMTPRRIRQRSRPRLALCRLARNRRPADRRNRQDARAAALRHEIFRRHAVAPKDHALHRAVRPAR